MERGAYLDGGGFDKTTASDIIHDLFIRPKGLQKSATRFGEGLLLTYLLQVIHNDIVILISSWGEGKNSDSDAGHKQMLLMTTSSFFRCSGCI